MVQEVLNKEGELDVRVLVPIQRHELLIKLFNDLPVKDTFTFINDHDPIPLFYEFRSIYGDVVGWEYLNKGGREWKVKVTKTDESIGREFNDISTLIDLRKVDEKEWKQVVFHRYGMMEKDTTMELILIPTLLRFMGFLFTNLKENTIGHTVKKMMESL
ncbi:MAG TPA: DUF2249 domain-containing protein [Fluviicola sp.]|nr:DUF2249 domain-containing protein [Fluviicola sp.]